jgi:hypothetical protein
MSFALRKRSRSSGWPDDHDLEELGVVGFEIADHPHLLERLAREGLGLVEHQHDRLAFDAKQCSR